MGINSKMLTGFTDYSRRRINVEANSSTSRWMDRFSRIEPLRMYQPLLSSKHQNQQTLLSKCCSSWFRNVTLASLIGISFTSLASAHNSFPPSEQTSSNAYADDQPDTDYSIFSFDVSNWSDLTRLHRYPYDLYTLRIQGCKFETLPDKLASKFSTLRHLDIFGCHSLTYFTHRRYPKFLKSLFIHNCENFVLPTLYKFAFLETLFIANSCNTLTSLPLDLFPKLNSLHVYGSPNLQFVSVSGYPVCLESLEHLDLGRCPNLTSFPFGGLPTPNLSSLRISNCKSLSKLPNFMKSLTRLRSLILDGCPKLESFPVGGLPSSLVIIAIRSCDKLTPNRKWGLDSLNNLRQFWVVGGWLDLESFPEEGLLPNNLNYLGITSLPSLRTLDYKGLQHLTALETLEINGCTNLQCSSNESLPSSLACLCIKECPQMTTKLLDKSNEHWSKIAHIPKIKIDGNVISAPRSWPDHF